MEIDSKVAERVQAVRGRLRAGGMVVRALARTLRDERRDGTLADTLRGSYRARTLVFAGEPTWGELLARRAVEDPDRPLLAFEDQRITVGQLAARADALAAALIDAGAVRGDHVAIMSPNCPEFLDAFFAVQRAGLGAVPVNTGLVGDGLAYVLDNAGCRFAFVHRDCLDAVLAVRARTPRLQTIVVISEGRAEDLPAGMPTLEQWRAGGRGQAPRVVPEPDDVALLMYTSGTTGLPKGVVYRFRDSNTKRMRLLANLLYGPDDVLYSCLPLYHANALLLGVIQALNLGSRFALSRRFSASRFWTEAAAMEATTFNALGAMIPILLKQPEADGDRAHAVRMVVSAACPANAWRTFEQRFATRIVEAYGAVDGGGFITINLGNAPVGSIGKPLGGARYRLVDADGREVADGETGELQVWTGERGGVEYHRDAAATQAKTRDGWLRTGDMMYRDRRGHLYFAGRNTDSMRRRGENVSALEVELVLDAQVQVQESAVFGVPSELGEEEIMAVVVPAPGQVIDPAALREQLRGQLAAHALPRYIAVVDELPRTGTYRVVKSTLKQRGTAGAWDAEEGRNR